MHASVVTDLDIFQNLPQPLAVVCHDAGAANLLIAWIAASGVSRVCRPVMAGPAARLWSERFPAGPATMSLDAAIDGAAALVSGTGWGSDLEHQARRHARARKIQSISVVDHWVNYAERFTFHGETLLPDQIWVSDDYAYDEARRSLPGVPIMVFPNMYLADQVARIAPVPVLDGDALYVLEPARGDWGRGQAGEFQALDYFVAHRHRLGLTPEAQIRLRPHPSDSPGKYDDWIAQRARLPISLDRSADLSAAIGSARWVLGCESFALVVALEAKRSVVCTLPPWAPSCRLPHRGLIHLKELAV